MNVSILNDLKFLNIYGEKDLFLKDISNISNENYMDLMQYNILSLTSSSSSDYIYSVSASLIDWTTYYYSITAFPYIVIGLPEVYDNILKGFSNFVVSSTANSNISLIDNYLLNNKKIIQTANLFEPGYGSLTSSITSYTNYNRNFIDYEKGVIIFHYPITSCEIATYSSSVRIKENNYICQVKLSEFTKSTNPTAYTDSLTSTVSGFTTPYIDTIGLYDDDNDLVAIARLSNPIRISDKLDMIFKISIDM